MTTSNGSSPAPSKDWADLPEWITVDDAATQSGYNPQHIRRLARAGMIGAEKKGRDWWIDRDKLRAYLETVQALGNSRFGPGGIERAKQAQHE
jgi:excisionase family DNA binding protein